MIRPSPWTILSAALIVLAFPPYDVAPLAWVALVPFFWVVSQSTSTRSAVIQGVWLSLFMTLGGFHWVAYSVQRFGNVPWVVSVACLVLFGLFNQLQFPIYAWLRAGKHASTPRTVLRTAAIYALLDWVVPKLWVDTLGYAFYDAPWIRQLASLGGGFLITFLCAWVSLALVDLLKSRKPITALKTSWSLIVVLVVCNFWGASENRKWTQIANDTESRVHFGVVQANIGDFDKVAAEHGFGNAGQRIVDQYMALSQSLLSSSPKPDLIVWPETAYPSAFGSPRSQLEFSRDQRINLFVKQAGVPLLFGGYDHHREMKRDFNSLFMITPETTHARSDLKVYHKSILLMFGEYIPGQDTFTWISRTFPQVGNFGKGPGPTVYEIPVGSPSVSSKALAPRILPMICYEALFPRFSVAGARLGANVIVNVTNDSWFGSWGEPHLHLALSAFRSIETRLSQVRSTNTGFTALILPSGDIVGKTRLFEIDPRTYSVPLVKGKTVFAQFPLGFAVLMIVILLSCKYVGRRP